jgi:peptidoglycan/xylan/chitin deacetylase (PgdA/CDA1 family)
MRAPAIPVVLCIDVEPDAFLTDRDRPLPWRGFEAAVARIAGLRRDLSRDGLVPHFSWFFRLDPQIAETYGVADWPLRHYAADVRALEAAGDEIGIHTHGYRWDAARGVWIQDHGDIRWLERCVRMSFEAFRGALGRECRTFRFGDRWMDNAMVALLERLGIRFDLTLEPGHRAVSSYHPETPSTGTIPDMRRAGRLPYRPSREDFLRADPSRTDGLIMIPVSTGRLRGAPLWHDRFWRVQRGLFRIAPVLGRLRTGARTLSLGFPVEDVGPVVDQTLARPGPRLLVLVARSDAFDDAAQRVNVEANLAYLHSRPEATSYRWSTPEEAVRLLGLP